MTILRIARNLGPLYLVLAVSSVAFAQTPNLPITCGNPEVFFSNAVNKGIPVDYVAGNTETVQQCADVCNADVSNCIWYYCINFKYCVVTYSQGTPGTGTGGGGTGGSVPLGQPGDACSSGGDCLSGQCLLGACL